MELYVAVWVNKQAVLCFVRSSHRLRHDVVVVPSRPRAEALVADRADAVWFLPEVR